MEQGALHHAISRGDGPVAGQSASLFPWWSVTKTVLAVAVLRLVDQGRPTPDDFVEDRCYTIRQLLQHISGLPDYGVPAYRAAVAACEPVWPVDELLRRWEAQRLRSAPDESFA